MRLNHSPYLDQILAAAPRLLGALDREPLSLSYGSFDREHWAWKFRDFPRGMLQNAIYPAALLWKHELPGSPYFANPRVRTWIHAAIGTMLSRQRANGAVDAFAPYDQDPGVTLMAVHNLSESLLLLREQCEAELRAQALRGMRRACDFALDRDEAHGFVSNHWALFALAYWNAAELLGDERLRKKSDSIVDRILTEQAREGWYREYEGPDPGYESLGIFYLAMLWERSRAPRALESLRRSVAFYAHFVHPDGSVGGTYGSRHTSLYFPGGFEILAAESEEAAAVARFLRPRLSRGNGVTPLLADAENLSPLLASYLEAAARYTGEVRGSAPALPCETLDGIRDFAESGISVVGRRRYYAVWNGRKGGVCRVFDRQTGELLHDDAGYCIDAGGRRWISQTIGMSQQTPASSPSARACEGTFAEYAQPIPTPVNFLALRLVNLTLFRSTAMGQWFRNWIVRKLILTKQAGPFRFRRAVEFADDKLVFSDTVLRTGSMPVKLVHWARALTGIHMGSAKYFHPAELRETATPDTREMAARLNSSGEARCAFEVPFAAPDQSPKPRDVLLAAPAAGRKAS